MCSIVAKLNRLARLSRCNEHLLYGNTNYVDEYYYADWLIPIGEMVGNPKGTNLRSRKLPFCILDSNN